MTVPLLLLAAAIALTTLWLRQRRRRRELAPCHRLRLRGELGERDAPQADSWSQYLELEERLFAELEERLVSPGGDEELDRYRRASPSYPGRQTIDGNRSFEIAANPSRGAVLLLHGLTDSPYSVHALARIFVRHGLTAVAPRLPGHGTAPIELAHRNRSSWRTAVRLAAERAARCAGNGPLYLGGYSLGAALALDLLLSGRWPADSPPERVFLFSPALGLGAAAWAADLHRLYGFLPGFEGGRWVTVDPEYDPFKYNSFPKSAGGQARRLVAEVNRALRRSGRDGSPGLPPVTAFQSVEDATVDSRPLAEHLGRGRFGAGSELVLFDRNRQSIFEALRRPRPCPLPGAKEAAAGLGYSLTRVEAAGPDGLALARVWPAGGGEPREEAVAGRWPAQVHSLSHVAVALPPDDPLYGDSPGTGDIPGDRRALTLGRWAPRGERARLRFAAGQLLRLRTNPFFDVVESAIERRLDLDR